MLRSIDLFKNIFSDKGIEIVTPNVIQTLTEDELIKIVPYVDGWIIGDDPATEKVVSSGKKGILKAAVKWGVGIDNIDFKAFEKFDIPITNTPKMFGNEVADIAISYLLGLARQTYLIDREVRRGNWIKPIGVSLEGKRVALVGLGDIGLAIARKLKVFGVSTIAYDPFIKLNYEEACVNDILAFPDKIEEADFVLLTCALTPSSYQMINEDTIQKMKDGVMLINVSRGGLIDEKALIKALYSGKIKAVGLDVFDYEPLPMDSPLRVFEHSIFGTHNGSNTKEAVTRASLKAIELLFNFLSVN